LACCCTHAIQRASTICSYQAIQRSSLIIKSRFGMRIDLGHDPRILLVDGNESSRGIAHWYRRADVLLALGNEGFGLPLVEAMATGLPVIALDSEGQSDVCREAGDRVLRVAPDRWEAVDELPYGRCGVRAVPSVTEITDRLRWVASHRDEGREMGQAASAWALRHRNVWNKGPAVLDVMERYLPMARPLRRVRTMLIPSLGFPCGIVEYSRDLAAALSPSKGGIRLAGEWPDLRGLRLLHIQQQDGIVADEELRRRIPDFAHAQVPVIVTEHSVSGQLREWERDVDVLVTLTERSAALLRRQWPRKSIELISHGCHTWFPPRKRIRGRVIAAFGFPERHKGFGRLLDVLRRVPGAELLLLSHAKQPGDHAWWIQHAAGLPVRHIDGFLPIDKVVRQLAAEADVLAFWYDEVPHASTSGAARVGLATGVPVITSPTGWFEDLQDVTYQPEDLIDGVERLLEDSVLRRRLVAASREYCHANSWSRVAAKHEGLWRRLEVS
jgi:glycosyltransferase involved in cell wall biosynthesis